MKNISETFNNLLETISTLRGEDGCPWDKAQTIDTLKKHVIEECGEILEAIDNHDDQNLSEELGDFLYLIIMMSMIEADKDSFTLANVIQGINDKLIRRHPHVFAGEDVKDEEEMQLQWNRIKASEKK